MSLLQEALYIVSNYPGGYRVIYDLIYGDKSSKEKDNFDNVLRVTLSRMKKKGLISNTDHQWTITKKGKKMLGSYNDETKIDKAKRVADKRQKKMILIFDIPEKKRGYRDWLRVELVALGFEQIQKSVWLGPGLPEEFVNELDERDMLQYVKFFNASESELI